MLKSLNLPSIKSHGLIRTTKKTLLIDGRFHSYSFSIVQIIPTGFKLNLKLWLKLYVSQLDTNYGLKQCGTQIKLVLWQARIVTVK